MTAFEVVKSLKNFFFSQVVIHSIRLPKNSTVGDVINELKSKVRIAAVAQVCCQVYAVLGYAD